MSEDRPEERKPRLFVQRVGGAIAPSGTVETRVAQAQAQIAQATGQANDATVRIEQLARTATTPEERQIVETFQTINTTQKAIGEDMLQAIIAMQRDISGLRTDQQASGKTVNRFNILFAVLGIGGVIIALIALIAK